MQAKGFLNQASAGAATRRIPAIVEAKDKEELLPERRAMIRHIVFFSAADRADTGRIIEALRRLGDIPHCDLFEVAENRKTDIWSNDVDIVVYGEFRDEEALAAFRAHPVYSEATKAVRPLRDMRIAADFISNMERQTQSHKRPIE